MKGFLPLIALVALGISNATEYPSVKAGGFIAGQFRYDQSEKISLSNEFKFNHLRIHIISNLSKEINGFIQVETKTGMVLLQNAFINFIPLSSSEIRFGYIKLPFGIEAYGHPLQNPVIDISQASKKIYRGAQDMGIHCAYEDKLAKGIVALVNGNNGTPLDNNNWKDLVGRLALMPVSNLSFGGSFYAGKKDTAKLTTNRFGAEVNYKQGPFWLRGELLGAKDEQAGGGEIKSLGYYGVIAVRFMPSIEGVFRYDYFDANTATGNNECFNFTLGLSYYFPAKSWNRVAINYEIRDDRTNPELKNLLTAQVQILF
ncbi:MAG: hypothetical protein ABIL05_00575 [candidate division WOR-3 bacterium]